MGKRNNNKFEKSNKLNNIEKWNDDIEWDENEDRIHAKKKHQDHRKQGKSKKHLDISNEPKERYDVWAE